MKKWLIFIIIVFSFLASCYHGIRYFKLTNADKVFSGEIITIEEERDSSITGNIFKSKGNSNEYKIYILNKRNYPITIHENKESILIIEKGFIDQVHIPRNIKIDSHERYINPDSEGVISFSTYLRQEEINGVIVYINSGNERLLCVSASFREKLLNKQSQSKILTLEKYPYNIEGVSESGDNPLVMINGRIYYLNNSICGGKIIEIFTNGITIEFPEKTKSYTIGEIIEK